jgi:hypothetical protein
MKDRYSGFYPNRYIELAKWDSGARIICLTRRKKRLYTEPAGEFIVAGMIERDIEHGISRVQRLGSFLSSIFVECNVKLVGW